MKRLIILLLLFFCVSKMIAQVGIGTTNPQAQLDVTGVM
jgi:hypothetical protein